MMDIQKIRDAVEAQAAVDRAQAERDCLRAAEERAERYSRLLSEAANLILNLDVNQIVKRMAGETAHRATDQLCFDADIPVLKGGTELMYGIDGKIYERQVKELLALTADHHSIPGLQATPALVLQSRDYEETGKQDTHTYGICFSINPVRNYKVYNNPGKIRGSPADTASFADARNYQKSDRRHYRAKLVYSAVVIESCPAPELIVPCPPTTPKRRGLLARLGFGSH